MQPQHAGINTKQELLKQIQRLESGPRKHINNYIEAHEKLVK